MQENLSELAKKYQEEMLRMYGRRKPPAPEELPPNPDLTGAKPDAAADQPLSPSLAPLPPDADDAQYDAAEDAVTLPEEPEDGALPSYIQPVVPQLPEEWAAQEAYENRNTAEGYLRVIAAAADSAYPVPDARVTVFTYIGRKLHLSYLLKTDENGETPTVPLPAPPADLSQEPENASPFASCDIRITAKGFFRTQARDVHIFAGVTTRQEFQLVPLPITSEPGDEDIDPNEIGRVRARTGQAFPNAPAAQRETCAVKGERHAER